MPRTAKTKTPTAKAAKPAAPKKPREKGRQEDRGDEARLQDRVRGPPSGGRTRGNQRSSTPCSARSWPSSRTSPRRPGSASWASRRPTRGRRSSSTTRHPQAAPHPEQRMMSFVYSSLETSDVVCSWSTPPRSSATATSSSWRSYAG